MNIDSIYFKGYSCFKKDWAGFAAIKPINVIIGRNNSGKSHLLDFVESLCNDKPFRREWQYMCSGELDEKSLKEVFSEHTNGDDLNGNHWHDHGLHLVNAIVTWEFITSGVTYPIFPKHVDSVRIDSQRDRRCTEQLSDAIISRVKSVIAEAMHHRNGTVLRLSRTTFRRLLADRDIETERPNTELMLGPDGQGATNIIRRFITSEKLPREIIQKELLTALNLIFRSDGRFSEIEVQVHDEAQTKAMKDHWEVYLSEETKGLIPLSKSGSGLKTVLLVLLNLLVVPRIDKDKSPFTFAFEELENNLHPALLRRLFEYLENYAVKEKAKIFLTTHSSELYTDSRLREGRDYQCVFYGGSVLSQVQFNPSEDEATKLANLFQINHNFVVVCDGDRTAGRSRLKPNVERIRAEVEKIDGAYIWITEAKGIENYLSGSVLEKVPNSVFKKAPDLSSLPDPGKYESWSSYTKKNTKRKTIDKVPLAISSTQYMTKEVMEKRFEWRKQMEQIVERIDSWNGESTST